MKVSGCVNENPLARIRESLTLITHFEPEYVHLLKYSLTQKIIEI
jgi:hypothetical protein